MLGIRKTALACAALGMAFSMSGQAGDQDVDKRFYIAPMATYTFIDEDTFEPDDAIGGQLALGKRLSKHLALELSYWRQDGADIEDPATSSGEIDEEGYQVSSLLFPIPDMAPVYLTVGIGAGTYDFDGVTTTRNVGNINDQDADFYDIGIGYQLPITDNGIKLRGEYRYRSADVDTAMGVNEFDFRDNVLALGIQIPLGERAEPEPEPKPAPQPEPKPEPVAPLDSDGDGVIDRNDRCPGSPRGTEVNADGCPVEKEAPIVRKGVRFKFDSAQLTEQAKDRLDNVVNALKGASDIDVRIEGHTDSLGDANYNLKLSKDRAKSVKRYLVDHGIEADRLTTEGYGETRPVAPNTMPDGSDNPDGRAKNRRVELHVVDE